MCDAASSSPLTLSPSQSNPRRHFLLSISPGDLDAYLITPTNNSDAPTRAISALHQLRGYIDEIAGTVSTEADALDKVVQSIQWNSPEKDELLCSVNLGNEKGLLSMILKVSETGVHSEPSEVSLC